MSAMLIPLILFILFLLYRMNSYSDSYEKIYNNISLANQFSIEFQTEFDSKMYQIIIGSSDFETEKPYEYLNQAIEIITRLKNKSLESKNVSNCNQVLKVLNNIITYTQIIEHNLAQDGPKYDKNMEVLDKDIRTSTQLIKDRTQIYVFNETFQMKTVREIQQVETKKTINIAFLLFFVLLLLIIGVIELISRSITQPIEKLCEAVKQVGEGNFGIRVKKTETEEVRILASSFNQMIEKISELIKDVKTEQINLRKTELKLLQAQINPHFFYNTMDTIIWLAEANRNREVSNMVTSFSNFFRTSLSKGRDFITVREEELHILSYLQIQKIRYVDILDYEIQIPEEYKEFQILKLTLQPLIENAIYHGIKNKRGKGNITVSCELVKDCLIFKVTDNGIGIRDESLIKLKQQLSNYNKAVDDNNGYGLVNVSERIKLNYGQEYGITVSSVYGEGTKMQIRIPAIIK